MSACLQSLNLETLAKVSDYEAVPGCGLKCMVSGVDSVVNNADITDCVNNMKNGSQSDSRLDNIVIDTRSTSNSGEYDLTHGAVNHCRC